MFTDIHFVLAWFGFVFLMLLLKLPFIIAANRSHQGHRVYHPYSLIHERFRRRAWQRR